MVEVSVPRKSPADKFMPHGAAHHGSTTCLSPSSEFAFSQGNSSNRRRRCNSSLSVGEFYTCIYRRTHLLGPSKPKITTPRTGQASDARKVPYSNLDSVFPLKSRLSLPQEPTTYPCHQQQHWHPRSSVWPTPRIRHQMKSRSPLRRLSWTWKPTSLN